MFTAQPHSWLARLHHHVARAQPLRRAGPADECRLLAHGFVGCNLVIDLTDFFGPLLRQDPAPVSGALTFRDLHAYLVNPPTTAERQALATLAGLPPGPAHLPWCAINLWLALEAYLRVLFRTAQAGWTNIAWHTFEQVLAPAGLGPAPCNSPTPPVAKAFEEWWAVAADRLTDLLANQLWPNRASFTTNLQVAGLLRRELDCAGPLVQLVAQKNNRLTNCISQLNQGLAAPVPPGWLGEVGGRLAAAAERGQTFTLSAADADGLGQMLSWLTAHGLDGRLAALAGGPAHALLHSLARQQAPQQVPHYEKGLPLLLDGWQALVRVAATRGLPDGWGVSRPVEDLFFYPLVQMSFARWYNVATRNYGLG